MILNLLVSGDETPKAGNKWRQTEEEEQMEEEKLVQDEEEQLEEAGSTS